MRIDVHHHLAPPEYLSGLPAHAYLQSQIKAWTIDKSLADMEAGGVTTAILTTTTPGFWFGDREQTRRLVRSSNDYSAKLVQQHPGRFGQFAMLPLPDVEGALKEIEYGLDVLKAQGISLFTNYRTQWLGDAAFDAVFAELNRRKATVHVHPDVPDCTRNTGQPHFRDSMIEYGTDTSRAIGHWIFSGSAARYPDIRFIWSHAGGTMPFILERFTREPLANPKLQALVPNGVLHELKKFHFDTAQAAHIHAMASLTQLADASHIVFGTDFPFRTSADHVAGLKRCGCFSDAELRAIDYENAQRLLMR